MGTSIEACRESSIECFLNVTLFRCLEAEKEEKDRLYAWEMTFDKKTYPQDTTTPVYFILDTINHNAFSHWVYENAVWLPVFLKLKETYPSLLLAIAGWKDYKKLYFKYYGIHLDSVCLQSDIQKENYCFFHTYTSFNDKNIPPIYYQNVFDYKMKIDTLSMHKTIPLLYLPRGTKENLQGSNNRVYNVQDQLKEYIKEVGGTVYETDTTSSLEDQINIVKSACIVVLDYGSNLWVNGMFAENSNILCLNIGWQHHPQYPAMGFLWDAIHQKNRVQEIFAHTSHQENPEDIPTVCFHMPTVMNTILHYLHLLTAKPVDGTQYRV